MSTIKAASCSRDDVQSAVDKAVAGDVVQLPPSPSGGIAWNAPLVWKAPPNVTFMGAGKDKTIIIDEYASTDPLFQFEPHADGFFKWFHMHIKGGNIGNENNTKWAGVIGVSSQCKQFWLEEVSIDVQSYTPKVVTTAIRFTGHVNGVVVPGLVRGHSSGGQIQVWYNGYNGASDVGDASFHAPTGFGGSDFLFVEDTHFETNSQYGGFACDSIQGGKIVVRDCTGLHTVQTHATTSGAGRGSRAMEIYRNKFKGIPETPSYCAVWLDSGCGLIWGNDSENIVHFQSQHARRRFDDGHGQNVTPVGYGYCGPAPQSGVVNVSGNKVTWVSGAKFNPLWHERTTMMFIGTDTDSPGFIIGSVQSDVELTLSPAGTNPNLPGDQTNAPYVMGSNWDGNEDPITGYPMMDQVGRGEGDLLKGWFPTMFNVTTGKGPSDPGAWPRQKLEPMYQFANNFIPAPGYSGVILEVADVMKEDRDFYKHKQNFDGTSGVGVGLFSNRPTTCIPGVGYFATDQEILYVCESQNVWKSYYKPYPHPHPLRAGGVPPPGTDPIPPDPNPPPTNTPPKVSLRLETPAGAVIDPSFPITIKNVKVKVVTADDVGPVVNKLFLNGIEVHTTEDYTFTYSWNTAPYKGKRVEIKAVSRDADNAETAGILNVIVHKNSH